MNEVERQRRVALAAAEGDFVRGRLTRRQFLQRCAQAGFGFGMALGAAHPVCAVPSLKQILDTLGPHSAMEPQTEQQKFLREVGKVFAGKTLRIVTENTPPSIATRELVKREFTPLTGIHVEWEQLPLDRLLAKVIGDIALAAGKQDVFYWDQAWIGRFVRDAVDPRELMAKTDLAYPGYDFDDILPPLVRRVASYQGQLAAIPFDIPVCIMIYRKDVFAELGLSVPKTIPEYLNVVSMIGKARMPRIYGTTEGWKVGHYSLLQKMTTWLWGHGGAFFNRDGSPAIDDDKAQAALQFMMELGKYMPPGVTAWDWSGEARSFARGQAGVYIGCGQYFPSYDDPAVSSIVGLAEAAACPAPAALRGPEQCAFDEVPGMSHQSGSCLAISRHSRNVDAAWVFVQWATSADVTTRASLLGGGASSIRFSNYKDPRSREMARVTEGTTRHFAATLDAIMNHMGTEPHPPAWPELSLEFAVELGKMTTGQQSIKATLANMSSRARQTVRAGA